MSRLFLDVQRAAAHDGGAAHPALRVRDLVATGQVTQHTISSPVVLPDEVSSSLVTTRTVVAAAPHNCAYCVSTPVGVLHDRAC